MDWLNLVATAVLLFFGIQAGIGLFKRRSKYYLALFIIILVFFLVTLFDLLYPGKFNSILATVIYVFSDNPTVVKTVRVAFNVALLVLFPLFLFYPNVKKFLVNPDSITNNNLKENIYRLAVNIFPRDTELLSRYAFFLFDVRKDYYKAEIYLHKAMEISPESASVLGVYALFLVKQGAYDEADKYFQQANEKPPYNAINLSNYAEFLGCIQKDQRMANEYHQRAIKLDPRNSRLLANYARFLSNNNDCDRAEEFFKKAIDVDSHNSYSLYRYANHLWLTQKEYKKADEYFREALKADPNNPDILFAYAYFLSDELKDYDRADQLFKKAIKALSSNAFHIAGYAYFLMDIKKDYDNAEKLFKRAIDLEPDNSKYLDVYALFLTNIRRDYIKAEQIYTKLMELDPENAANLCNYSRVLILRGNFNKAKTTISKAFEQTEKPKDSSIELELWFYRYAIFYQQYSEAESNMQSLLSQGITSHEPGLKDVLEVAKKRNHPNYEKLFQLEALISN